MNSYIVDCLEPQPGSFTSTLRADARPHEHASSGWGGAPLYIQVPSLFLFRALRWVTVLGCRAEVTFWLRVGCYGVVLAGFGDDCVP
jgi:hypothetical protein